MKVYICGKKFRFDYRDVIIDSPFQYLLSLLVTSSPRSNRGACPSW